MSKRRWTPEDIEFLRTHAEELTNVQLAKHFGVSEHTLATRLSKCGIRRSHAARVAMNGWKAAGKLQTREQRFWQKVVKRGHDACWGWAGRVEPASGYGYLSVRDRPVLAHRFAWELANGRKLRSGEQVNHTCDTRSCTNPRHLYAGTQYDNIHDMLRRGRAKPPRGECHPHAKLTERRVRAIRRRHASGERAADLARRFSVSSATVYRVLTRACWDHVT